MSYFLLLQSLCNMPIKPLSHTNKALKADQLSLTDRLTKASLECR